MRTTGEPKEAKTEQIIYHSSSLLLPASHQATRVNFKNSEVMEGEEQASLLSDEDERRIYSWNKLPPQQTSGCVHELIRERCLAQPNAPAVCAWDGDFTYRELDNLSSELAAHLVQLSVGPEVFVPLCFEKSRWTTVAMVGVMKAGAAFVLLDPSHPQVRLLEICQAVSARVILVSTQQAVMASNLASRIVVVGNGHTEWNCINDDQRRLSSSVAAENALYAVFTSGSTGTPKGVVIEHGSFYATVKPYSKALNLSHDSRVFLFASYAFDVCIFDTLTVLIAGGCVCVPSETDRWGDIGKAASHFRITNASFTPTLAKILDPADLPSLKTLVLGGEMLPQADLAKWVDRVGVINLYGASECPLVTMTEFERGTDSEFRQTRHHTGSVCWIVHPDDHEKLLPIGSEGELLIQGPTVGRGYLNDPQRTAATFIKDPPAWLAHCSGSDSAGKFRLYKTGDLAKYGPDGSVRTVGRKDNQVKLRGQRIELGEVEHHVRQCFQGARDVVAEVVTPTDSARVPILVTFIWDGSRHNDEVQQNGHVDKSSYLETGPKHMFAVPTDEFCSKIPLAESQLNRSLPSYMVPTAFIPLCTVPLTKTGKTDRRKLREWAAALSRADLDVYRGEKSEKRAPATVAERLLQQLWAQVLSLPLDRVGTDDSFMRLGGDSVLAMQVASRARAKDMNISAQDILNRKTIARVASYADMAGPIEADRDRRVVPFSLLPVGKQVLDGLISRCIARFRLKDRQDIEDIFPCSAMQEEILLIQAKFPACYRITAVWKVTSKTNIKQNENAVDINRLQAAWSEVVHRHQILRTVVMEEGFQGATCVQVVLRRASNPVLFVESRTLEQFKALPETNTYDGEAGLPYRISICKTDTGEVYFKIVTSHVITDGSSIQIMLRELAAAYEGNLLGEDPPPLYSEYIAYTRQQLAEDRIGFWKSYLAGVEPCYFPALNKCATGPAELFTVEDHMSKDGIVAIRKLCKQHEVTLANVFNVVWALVLRSYTGNNSVCFSYVTSGRDVRLRSVNDVLGPLITLMLYRFFFQASTTLLSLVKENNETYTQSLDHQHGGLLEMSHLMGMRGQMPFNTCVNVQREISPSRPQNDAVCGGIILADESQYGPCDVCYNDYWILDWGR